MFTLRDRYSFRAWSDGDSGKELPWITLDGNLILRFLSPTIFLLLGKDFDVEDRMFITREGAFPCGVGSGGASGKW